jgi:hypothetical protein
MAIHRDYIVRFNPFRKDWELWRLVGTNPVAGLIASYATRDEAVAGCVSICSKIVEAGHTATLSVRDELANVIAERVFPPP